MRKMIERLDFYRSQRSPGTQHDCPIFYGELREILKAGEEKINRFVAPSVFEVASYCLERQNKVDPSRFHDYYTSNGWMAGKVKMKDWKAAVRNWEKRGTSQAVGATYDNNEGAL